jgi:serine/threonine-protein kinase ATR
MQGLLKFCQLNVAVTQTQRTRDLQGDEKYQRWMELPESVRNTLTPFLTSTYTVTVVPTKSKVNYPLFSPDMTHSEWLRTLVQDLLKTSRGDNARTVFHVCSRVVKGQDISISSFLLPFAILNRVVGGTEQEQLDLQLELTKVLSYPLPDTNSNLRETILSCSQVNFPFLSFYIQFRPSNILTNTSSFAERFRGFGLSVKVAPRQEETHEWSESTGPSIIKSIA